MSCSSTMLPLDDDAEIELENELYDDIGVPGQGEDMNVSMGCAKQKTRAGTSRNRKS